ncbi:predicted protein [Plenodomus lingam JN3]|uniref:Predicted protein n=1 Tax=Leptosphaeria maculans (strain JN3 / isolate v23.1.3 / race Av1-4-5-6-7-8) TaxID=985895 RepID=E4ZPS8_LEPMJ|nr:predicted protein [Plenodomus lingam JN3]CBX93463.1 predicted protein [Plenodomus lingam JN3]
MSLRSPYRNGAYTDNADAGHDQRDAASPSSTRPTNTWFASGFDAMEKYLEPFRKDFASRCLEIQEGVTRALHQQTKAMRNTIQDHKAMIDRVHTNVAALNNGIITLTECYKNLLTRWESLESRVKSNENVLLAPASPHSPDGNENPTTLDTCATEAPSIQDRPALTKFEYAYKTARMHGKVLREHSDSLKTFWRLLKSNAEELTELKTHHAAETTALGRTIERLTENTRGNVDAIKMEALEHRVSQLEREKKNLADSIRPLSEQFAGFRVATEQRISVLESTHKTSIHTLQQRLLHLEQENTTSSAETAALTSGHIVLHSMLDALSPSSPDSIIKRLAELEAQASSASTNKDLAAFRSDLEILQIRSESSGTVIEYLRRNMERLTKKILTHATAAQFAKPDTEDLARQRVGLPQTFSPCTND